MATVKKNEKYLLLLVGPVNSFPVGLYDTPEEALEAAVEHGIPADGTDLTNVCPGNDARQSLYDAEYYGPLCYSDLGVDANKKPRGYAVVKFAANGSVDGCCHIEPYSDHDPVLPGAAGADRKIDPDQELTF